MNYLTHILKKHRATVLGILSVIALLAIYLSSQSQAAFAPGTELDPACEPGDAGCVVEIPVTSPGGSSGDVQYNNGGSFGGSDSVDVINRKLIDSLGDQSVNWETHKLTISDSSPTDTSVDWFNHELQSPGFLGGPVLAVDWGNRQLNDTSGNSVLDWGSGSVGIGTASPGAKLEVSVGNVEGIKVSSTNSPYVRMYSSSGNSESRNWGLATNYDGSGYFQLQHSASNITDPTTTYLLIDAVDGFMGIGSGRGLSTTNRIGVNGSVEIGGGFYNNNAPTNGLLVEGKTLLGGSSEIFYNTVGPLSAGLNVQSSVNPFAVITNAAGLGMQIGTTGETGNSYIQGIRAPDNPGATNALIAFKSTNGHVSYGFSSLEHNDDKHNFWLNTNSDKLSILNYDTRTADQGSNIYFKIRAENGSSTYPEIAAIKALANDNAGSGNNTGYLSFYTQGTSFDEKMRITSDGKVGIGTTSPATTLQVSNVTYSSPLNANIRMSSQHPGISFDNTGASGNRRNFAFINEYNTQGNFEFLYSTVADGDPTTSGWVYDALNSRLMINPPFGYIAGGVNNDLIVPGAVEIGNGFREYDAPTNGLLVEGNVSIGTTSPAANHALDIVGGNLKIGTDVDQKGITLYDTVTGDAYCVTIASGALAVGALDVPCS